MTTTIDWLRWARQHAMGLPPCCRSEQPILPIVLIKAPILTIFFVLLIVSIKRSSKRSLSACLRYMYTYCNVAGERSMIKKRYFHLTEEILKKHPNICEYKAPSLKARQEIAILEVPKLGKEAAEKAINEWSQSKSRITHLIFCTTSGVDVPGADYQLTKLLGLSPSIKRFMMYQQGCFAGGTALRLAKDIAENNKGARVLVVCSIGNQFVLLSCTK